MKVLLLWKAKCSICKKERVMGTVADPDETISMYEAIDRKEDQLGYEWLEDTSVPDPDAPDLLCCPECLKKMREATS